MTHKEIYKKANNVVGLEGMTGNERLFESGLMNEFDNAKKTDKHLARTILQALKFDELSIGRILGNSIETLKYPNPWDFPNENSNGLDNEYEAKINYLNPNEIGMGGPLGGLCELKMQRKKKILIDKWCGGPAIWNKTKLKMAIPIWERSFLRTIQRIGILDLTYLTLTKYQTKFRILDLRTFGENSIRGFDSPIHRTKLIEFDIENQQVKSTTRLK